MKLAHVFAAFKSIGRDWKYVMTGTLAPAMLSVLLWFISPHTFKSHPIISCSILFAWWSLVWGWAFVRSWNREHEAVNRHKREADEIYADVVLAWLLQGKPDGFAAHNAADSIGLDKDQIIRGLMVLKAEFGVVDGPMSGDWWKFIKTKDPMPRPIFEKLFRSSSSAASAG